MKNIAVLWLIAFVLASISIAYTHALMISPIWVVNIIIAFYLVKFRKFSAHPVFVFVFSFTPVFLASYLFDQSKTLEVKALLSLIGAVQIMSFVYVCYYLVHQLKQYAYFHTLIITLPNLISSAFGAVLFMLLFDFGLNYYEFLDYFLEQFATGLSLMCIFYGASHWRNIPPHDYALIVVAWMIQYLISTDPIFYACFIFPFLMCYFALKYKLKEFSLVIGLLTFVCSYYISMPVAGEYWSASDTHMLSRLSTYRLALACYLIIFLFICEIYLKNRRLSVSYERLMFCDELTGLKNRRFIREKVLMDSELRNGYLLLLDIDNFKAVNDRYGHHIGDLVIQHITQILNQLQLKQPKLVRWGGEEFLVLVPCADVEQCRSTCQAVLDACRMQPFQYKDYCLEITVSIGATMFDRFDLSNYVHWIQEADQCLYQAKAQGKKQYQMKA